MKRIPHIVGKFTLPPSDFVCVYEQDKKQGSSTFILYWLGLRENPESPRELTDEDKLVLGLVSAAVRQQSDGTFQGYWSGKGYFNAIYLNATLQHNGWAFEDYKYTSKP